MKNSRKMGKASNRIWRDIEGV